MRTLKQVATNMADAFTRFGLWKGGGSGGSSALSEMTDVRFTNLQANDILKYNGNKWVNDDNLTTTKVDKSVNGVVILKNGKNIELIINIDKELKSYSWNTILTIPQEQFAGITLMIIQCKYLYIMMVILLYLVLQMQK